MECINEMLSCTTDNPAGPDRIFAPGGDKCCSLTAKPAAVAGGGLVAGGYRSRVVRMWLVVRVVLAVRVVLVV
jgi:hypothetical protein